MSVAHFYFLNRQEIFRKISPYRFLCDVFVRFHAQSTAGYAIRGLRVSTFLAIRGTLYNMTLRAPRESIAQ